MRIEIDRLGERGEKFAYEYAPEGLSLDGETLRLAAPAEVEGRAGLRGREVSLEGRLRARVEARCDRCLRPVTSAVEVEFAERFVPPGDEANAAERELQPDDLAFSVYQDGAVDLDELVREQILLALPTRLLCEEDCRGLCPKCGADLNAGACACEQGEVDPRWAALAKLKNPEP